MESIKDEKELVTLMFKKSIQLFVVCDVYEIMRIQTNLVKWYNKILLKNNELIKNK